jgi:probable addiction module antidote protein
MKETLIPYDSANYLDDEEDIAGYLAACAAENDPALMTHALGVVARARNMSALARDVGMTRVGLYKALSAEGNPSFATITEVANALGFRVGFYPAIKTTAKAEGRPKAAAKRSVVRKVSKAN